MKPHLLRIATLFFLFPFPFSVSLKAQENGKHVLSGYVREAGSREPLVGASVYIPRLRKGTSTNGFGYYALHLPDDTVTVHFRYVGYQIQTLLVKPGADVQHSVELAEGKDLNEVTIIGQVDTMPRLAESVQMSQLSIRPSDVKNIPALLGEKDVLKVFQLMPGVQKGSEGSAGLYVRGGGPDQNLILLDDAPVYNAFHLFGFFSVFNGDALKTIELTKGGFPARYGGRLSSVLEMRMKEGNQQKIKGEGSVGLIASRLTIEGPIQKGKSSFLVSGRRSYLDILAAPFQPGDEKVKFYLYDLNVKVNHQFSEKDKLYLSGYFGRDLFGFVSRQSSFGDKEEGGIYWGNATSTLRWNHVFNPRLFANFSAIYSRYRFNLYNESKSNGQVYKMKYYSGIEDFSAKADFDYYFNDQHHIRFGALNIWHVFTPSAIVYRDDAVGESSNTVKRYGSLESNLYVEDEFRVNEKLSLNTGLRPALFYTDGKTRVRLEPRLAGRYKFNKDLSLKASFTDMNQFIHLLSNTGIGLPTDLWIPSSPKVSPQRSQQVALGLAKDLEKYDVTVSLEGYYKRMRQVIQYREGASFLDVESSKNQIADYAWENEIVRGNGWSSGLEVLVQKHVGKWTGWIGYTLSWTRFQFPDLNFGKPFYARYDRRHDLSLVGIYKIREGLTVSATWVYGTGSAFTMPISSYTVPEHNPVNPIRNSMYGYFGNATEYSAKNAYRMAAFHRLDVGIQWHKKKTWGERTWELSVYNLYNRRNPFFYYIGSSTDTRGQSYNTLKQVSLFPFIPSLSYSFKF